MVAVIGARGSGKTALVDMIASGANAMGSALGESSFLKRASSPVDYLENARVELAWADDSTSETPLSPRVTGAPEDRSSESVCYLSQHFVERLCSSAGLAIALRGEMERVVFAATDPTERLEANSFEELANILLEPIRWRRTEILTAIQSATDSIVREDLLRARLPKMLTDRDALAIKIRQARKEIQSLLPKGKEDRARYLTRLEEACVKTEAKLENLRRRRKALDDLAAEVAHVVTSTEPSRLAEMRRRFTAAAISDLDWAAFGMKFKGDVDEILDRTKRIAEVAIIAATDAVPNSLVELDKVPPNEWPLNYLKAKRDTVKKGRSRRETAEEIRRASAMARTSGHIIPPVGTRHQGCRGCADQTAGIHRFAPQGI